MTSEAGSGAGWNSLFPTLCFLFRPAYAIQSEVGYMKAGFGAARNHLPKQVSSLE